MRVAGKSLGLFFHFFALPFLQEPAASTRMDHHLAGGRAGVALSKENGWQFTSESFVPQCPFNEVLLSWNVKCPSGSGFLVELRVGQGGSEDWSPFLLIGSWGSGVPKQKNRLTQFEKGKIDVDYFCGSERFDRVQYRIQAFPRDVSRRDEAQVYVEAVWIASSDTTGLPRHIDHSHCNGLASPFRPVAPVPLRSQKLERPELASRICSPTSLAMVLEYFGKSVSTERVAQLLYDQEHDIYGNWTHAIQGAFEMGVPGYLDRCCDMDEAREILSEGNPLIISIRAQLGQLAGAPYEKTSGHLLVLTGFDGEGNFFANDPASPSLVGVRRVYKEKELERVWIQNAKGTAYLFSRGVENPMALTECSRVAQDLRYAVEANFTKKTLYAKARGYLRLPVAKCLQRADESLRSQFGLRLKILDAYRPHSVQKKMWEILPDERYVANPAKGSRHNRGAAVDVTLIDKDGKDLEMPSAFDHFGPESHRDYQGGSEQARKNRKILQDAMEAEGFVGLPTEWWHFDDPEWEKYPILDIPLEELP